MASFSCSLGFSVCPFSRVVRASAPGRPPVFVVGVPACVPCSGVALAAWVSSCAGPRQPWSASVVLRAPVGRPRLSFSSLLAACRVPPVLGFAGCPFCRGWPSGAAPVSLAAFPSLLVGGSRSLPFASWPAVAAALRPALRAFVPLNVGCAVGADAAAINAALSAGAARRLSVFCVGDPASGAGFWSGSAVASVGAAAAAGARVVPWAGGPASWPLSARLSTRTHAAVTCSSACLFFFSSPRSRGSLAAAAFSARHGRPVFVCCVGFSPSLLPPLAVGGSGGSWAPLGGSWALWRPGARLL